MIAAVCIIAAIWVGRGLMDFDLSENRQRDFAFTFDDAVLSGTLFLPKDVIAPPIALIIHGGGAQDRFSDKVDLPLIDALADASIGVFFWDKAWVGASTGNWLNQSMEDRANEALAV